MNSSRESSSPNISRVSDSKYSTYREHKITVNMHGHNAPYEYQSYSRTENTPPKEKSTPLSSTRYIKTDMDAEWEAHAYTYSNNIPQTLSAYPSTKKYTKVNRVKMDLEEGPDEDFFGIDRLISKDDFKVNKVPDRESGNKWNDNNIRDSLGTFSLFLHSTIN